MPRDLTLGNGRMLVTFDSRYSLSDIYYPHIGTENHAYQRHSRLGVWADGDFAWLDDSSWERSLRYADHTLVTRVEARNARLGLHLTLADAVDFDRNVLLRRFTVINTSPTPAEVRLFLHLDIALGGNSVGDTVFYHPEYGALVAYKNVHYLLLSGQTSERTGLDGWTASPKGAGYGSWVDAEDGALNGTPLAFGAVDCVGELRLGTVLPDRPTVAHGWLAAASSLEDVGELHASVLGRGPDSYIERTRHYWHGWVAKEGERLSGLEILPKAVQELYVRSLLLARAQTDAAGAIVASPDSDISGAYSPTGKSVAPVTDLFRGHENYAYCWPRDGSFVAIALNDAGYDPAARRFLEFCARNMSQSRDGRHAYMLQKYLSNGSVASNVIAWIDDRGASRLPIQEDETALVLIALRNHYERTHDWEFVASLYHGMMTKMANFLADFRDPATGLPLPSQDLWEEGEGVHAFTVATVWRALRDVAYFTELFSEPALTELYLRAADEIKRGVEEHIYDDAAGRFARALRRDHLGRYQRDSTVDASLWALSYFGMFDADDPRMVATMASVESTLTVAGEHGGLARYEGDRYQQRQRAADMGVAGNPWFLCTLWLAQYKVQRAKHLADLEPALRLIERVAAGALPSGALPEQIDPASGEPAGATPLTWAHGTVVLTVLQYLATRAGLVTRSE